MKIVYNAETRTFSLFSDTFTHYTRHAPEIIQSGKLGIHGDADVSVFDLDDDQIRNGGYDWNDMNRNIRKRDARLKKTWFKNKAIEDKYKQLLKEGYSKEEANELAQSDRPYTGPYLARITKDWDNGHVFRTAPHVEHVPRAYRQRTLLDGDNGGIDPRSRDSKVYRILGKLSDGSQVSDIPETQGNMGHIYFDEADEVSHPMVGERRLKPSQIDHDSLMIEIPKGADVPGVDTQYYEDMKSIPKEKYNLNDPDTRHVYRHGDAYNRGTYKSRGKK